MKAMSVIPGHPGSELVAERPDPPPGQGSVLVEGLLAGIAGPTRRSCAAAGNRRTKARGW